jgi:hypothetical protein
VRRWIFSFLRRNLRDMFLWHIFGSFLSLFPFLSYSRRHHHRRHHRRRRRRRHRHHHHHYHHHHNTNKLFIIFRRPMVLEQKRNLAQNVELLKLQLIGDQQRNPIVCVSIICTPTLMVIVYNVLQASGMMIRILGIIANVCLLNI